MSEPPRADLLLLRRKGKAWTRAQRDSLPDGIRDRNNRYHLLECKFTESVNEWAIQQALAYDLLYWRTQRLKPADLQTYVISAKTPDADFLGRLGYQQEAAGVYVTGQPILARIVLIVLNELRNEPHNEFFRLFASRQRVRKETMNEVLQQQPVHWPDPIWSIIFGLQRLYQLEGENMNRELTVEDVMEIGHTLRKQAIATASPDELSEQVRKRIIASASPAERLAGMAPEERLAGMAPEERLAGMAPEEMALLLEQIETMLSQQKIARKPRRARVRKKR